MPEVFARNVITKKMVIKLSPKVTNLHSTVSTSLKDMKATVFVNLAMRNNAN